MTKKWFEIGANLIFWLLTSWLILSSFSIQSHEINIDNGVETVNIIRDKSIILQLLICILWALLLFYTNLNNILQLKHGGQASQIFLKSILLFIVALLLQKILEPFVSKIQLPKSLSWGTITFYFTISIAYGLAKVWQNTEMQKQQLAIEKKQAELSLLRRQLHPHFLFNVLNNLLAMVNQKENPALAHSLDRLSGLLRYVVYDTTANKVTVKKEIDFIKNFAELQSLRFEKDELVFNLEVLGDYDHQEIEPGIFIPFIENAFKYGVEPEEQSRIDITFDLREKSTIIFNCSNPIHPTMQQLSGNGSGIPSSQKRLKLVYPNKHKLTIIKTPLFEVKLQIDTNESNNS